MRIAFEVNGVLRDTIKKLESTYEKYLIDELEVGEEEEQFQYEIVRPINTEIIKDHFKFQSDDELYEFIYIENPMTIFGHAPSTEMNTFQVLNQIYKELRDDNQIIIVSDEIGRSKPSTLFFLSKFGCEIEEILFYNDKTIDRILKDVDVLVTCNTSLINDYKNWIPNVVLFNNEQNTSYEYDKRIYSLEEFINFYKNNIINV
jgi:hypothetical protein